MTIRADKFQILKSIIISIPVLVMNLQNLVLVVMTSFTMLAASFQ